MESKGPSKLNGKQIVTIFEIAKVNGAIYRGENLPSYPWMWPNSSWLKKRMETIKKDSEEEQR